MHLLHHARLAIAGLLLGAAPASASILVTEPFDYNVGVFTQSTTTNDWIGTMGGTSGTGWSPRNWFSHTGGGSLKFGIATGGHTGTFADSTGLNNLTNAYRERAMSPAVHNNTDGSVIWQHLTMSRSGTGQSGQWNTQNSSGGMHFAVRIDSTGKYALVAGHGNVHLQTSTISASTDATHPDVIVVKMENQTDASTNLFDVSMWINPTAPTAAGLPEPDLKIVGTTPFDNSRNIGTVNWVPGNTQVDNFKLATTYEDFEIGTVVEGPLIVVKQGATTLTDGSGTLAFGPSIVGVALDKELTITNAGTTALTLGAITLDGAGAADFTATTPAQSLLAAGESTTFIVTFTPSTAGEKTATLHIASDSPGALESFDIALTGTGLSTTADTDGDGLNDAAEFALADLGFNWQVNQANLVNALFNGAPSAGLHTAAQIQAQNPGVPLLAKDATTGDFTLTLGLETSTELEDFEPLPITAPDLLITPEGQLQFTLTPEPNSNAAFYRLRAR